MALAEMNWDNLMENYLELGVELGIVKKLNDE